VSRLGVELPWNKREGTGLSRHLAGAWTATADISRASTVTYAMRAVFHLEDRKGTSSKVLHFQLRPDPLGEVGGAKLAAM